MTVPFIESRDGRRGLWGFKSGGFPISHKVEVLRESFCGLGEGVRLPRSPGDFRGSPGNFRGSPGNFWGSLGNFRGSPGTFQKLRGA